MPPAQNVSFRLRDFEIAQIDALATEMGYSSRADVIRAALDLLRLPEQRGYRKARRVENVAIKLVDELRSTYGSNARFEVESTGSREVKLTVAGQVPEGLRAELVPIDGHEQAGQLVLIAEKSLTGEDQDLALSPGLGLDWDQWDEGTTSMQLASLYPRVGPDNAPTPLKDPAY